MISKVSGFNHLWFWFYRDKFTGKGSQFGILLTLTMCNFSSLVIRQKGESQNGCFKKKSVPNFSKNEYFLPPDTHAYVCIQVVRNVCFLGNLTCFVFLKHPFCDSSCCYFTDEFFFSKVLETFITHQSLQDLCMGEFLGVKLKSRSQCGLK